MSFVALPAIAENSAPPAQTHALFMGADIYVKYEGELYRVEDVSGDSFVIKVKGREVSIPLNLQTVEMSVKQSLKLTRVALTVTNLAGERTYTRGNSPGERLNRSLIEQANMSASAQSAVNVATETQARVLSAAPQALANLDPRDITGGPKIQSLVDHANSQVQMTTGAPGAHPTVQLDSGRDDAFDAMEINFEVSAEKPVQHPYVVVTAQYRDENARPGEFQSWFYARELAPIDSRPQKVHILQGGFTPAYELKKFNIHIYDHGLELATNVAEKNVRLTSDEAHEYIVLDYVSAHKGQTVNPSLVTGLKPRDPSVHYTDAQLQGETFVKVGKDGLPNGAFRNAACTETSGDAGLVSLVQAARFKPALKDGKAVDGVIKLRWADLTL